MTEVLAVKSNGLEVWEGVTASFYQITWRYRAVWLGCGWRIGEKMGPGLYLTY